MAWIRLDDQIAHHPKFTQVGPVASWMWVACIGYSQRYLTDGFVPKGAMSSLIGTPRPQSYIARLLAAGLLEKVEDGYRVHDYHDYNQSAAEVKADKEWDRVRKELYSRPDLVSAIKRRDNNRCRYCEVAVNWTDRRGEHGGQFDHIVPRGPNTFENLVVSCRRCNIKKGNRLAEDCGMTLRPVPSSELVPNQVGPSSLPVYARTRSHPIPSHPIKKISNTNNEMGPSPEPHPSNGKGSDNGNGNGHETPDQARTFIAWFHQEYKIQRHGADYLVHRKKDEPIVRFLLKHYAIARLQDLAKILLSDKTDDSFIQSTDRGINILKMKANWLNDRLCTLEHRNGLH